MTSSVTISKMPCCEESRERFVICCLRNPAFIGFSPIVFKLDLAPSLHGSWASLPNAAYPSNKLYETRRRVMSH